MPYRTGTLAPELFVLGIAEIVSMQRMGPSALPLFLLALREARLEFAVAPVAPAPSPLSDVEKRAVSTTVVFPALCRVSLLCVETILSRVGNSLTRRNSSRAMPEEQSPPTAD